MMGCKLLTRNEVPLEEKWNIEALYASESLFEEELKKGEEEGKKGWPELQKLQGALKRSHKNIGALLLTYFTIQQQLEKLYTYAHLKNDEDLSYETGTNFYNRALTLWHLFEEKTAWIVPEILEEEEGDLLQVEEAKPFHFSLKQWFRLKKHTLKEREEKLLALAMPPLDAFQKGFMAASYVDLTFKEVVDSEGKSHPLTPGTFSVLIRSEDRVLRENTFKTFHKTFDQFSHLFSELLYGEVKKHLFVAKARHHTSCLKSALFPHAITPSVYFSLKETVREEGLKSLHRYVSLKKKLLGLKKFYYYDLFAPIQPASKRLFSFKEAANIVVDSLSPLGEEYQRVLSKGLFEERWVDVPETKNKRGSAYSSGCYDSMPYILMNFQGTINDVMTLSHECGHSMHSYMSHLNQPYHTASYPIFLAEIASTLNEECTFQYLLKECSKEEKVPFLMERLDQMRSTFFRQVMFAEFEELIHSLVETGHPLTPNLLKEEYHALNQDYFGKELHIDKELKAEWMRIPHFYYNFYVYQYATGISGAYAFLSQIDGDKKEGLSRYLSFLSSGGSKYPLTLLNSFGIDMETKKPFKAFLKRFDALLDEVEGLL